MSESCKILSDGALRGRRSVALDVPGSQVFDPIEKERACRMAIPFKFYRETRSNLFSGSFTLLRVISRPNAKRPDNCLANK